MNVLDREKARQLYRLFSYGHGIRESARLVGCNRGTAIRYHRKWLEVRPQLQQAYDAMWEHETDKCDAILAPLPPDPVLAMFDAWMDDQAGDVIPKSGFHAGFESTPNAPENT